MKINLDLIPIKNAVSIQRIKDEYHLKTDGPIDKSQGSYLVLKADGTIFRRTLDKEGFIIHEIKIR